MSTGTIDSMQNAHGVDTSMSHNFHNEQRQQAGTTTDTGSHIPAKLKQVILVGALVALLVYELLSLITWLPIAGLSGMAFDSGFSWGGALLVGPIFMYPLFILVCWLRVPFLVAGKRHWRAVIQGIAPPLLAFGPMMLFSLIHSIGDWLMAVF